MSRDVTVCRALVAGLLAVVIGCSTAGRAAGVGSAADPAQVDTIVGTVRLVGTDSSSQVILVPTFGGLPVKLIGLSTLRSVEGLRVQVVGTQASDRRWPDRMTVRLFTVVAAHGQPTIDGTVAEDGGTLYVVTADGVRHALVRPSPNLRAHVGARVWVSGPLDREPSAYGIIE
jgi:hypothetical protein